MAQALPTTPVGRLVKGFLLREGPSPSTVKAYGWALRDFTDFLGNEGVDDLRDLSRAMLEAWQARAVERKMKSRSRSLATTAVRQFLRWAGERDYCDPRLAYRLAPVPVPPRRPRPLSPEALSVLMAYYSQTPGLDDPYRLHRLRNAALFFYFVTSGARVTEALSAQRHELERFAVRRRDGAVKVLTVPKSVEPIVNRYLAERTDSSPLLFVSHPGGKPMDPTSVRRVWQTITGRLGLPVFTSDQLRQTYVAVEARAGARAMYGLDERVKAPLANLGRPDPRQPRRPGERGGPKLRIPVQEIVTGGAMDGADFMDDFIGWSIATGEAPVATPDQQKGLEGDEAPVVPSTGALFSDPRADPEPSGRRGRPKLRLPAEWRAPVPTP